MQEKIYEIKKVEMPSTSQPETTDTIRQLEESGFPSSISQVPGTLADAVSDINNTISSAVTQTPLLRDVFHRDDIESLVLGIETLGVVGLVVAAAGGAAGYFRSDPYFARSQAKAYVRQGEGLSRAERRKLLGSRGQKVEKFRRKAEGMLAECSDGYQNKAMRLIVKGSLNTKDPLTALRQIDDKLTPGMSGDAMITVATQYLKDDDLARRQYLES